MSDFCDDRYIHEQDVADATERAYEEGYAAGLEAGRPWRRWLRLARARFASLVARPDPVVPGGVDDDIPF